MPTAYVARLGFGMLWNFIELAIHRILLAAKRLLRLGVFELTLVLALLGGAPASANEDRSGTD